MPENRGAIHEDIAEMKADIKSILEKLKEGAVSFARYGVRISVLEKLVYGAVGLFLIGAVGVVIKVVWNGS